MKLVANSAAIRKRAKGQCLVYGCTKKAYKKRNAKKPEKYCNQHQHEIRKEKNPVVYWCAVLRRNAKRRGKAFTITIDDFREFCNESEYLQKKGRSSASMTVDRIIDELGYVPGNIQPMKNGDNVRKRYTDYYKHNPDPGWSVPILDEEDWEKPKEYDPDEDLPF